MNVMCGGSMYQHVDGHAGVKHKAWDVRTNEYFEVTSTHHQMMIAGEAGEVIVAARCSSKKERMKVDYGILVLYDNTPLDVEVVYYPWTNCLCFQPHPEFAGEEELAIRYIDYVEDLCLKGSSIIASNV